ncbi:MAG: VIT1/CCC1 transporter family protein [Chloroflexi bacterium]|nr:VIT1/CCC1 transporter family protein [Chloroflexota bacterium]
MAERDGASGPRREDDIRRYRANLKAENDGVALYRAMAAAESDAERKQLYADLARAEQRHADLWIARLRAVGASADVGGPSFRARVLGWLARHFGNRAVIGIVDSLERRDAAGYANQPGTADLAWEEDSHAQTFRQLARGAGETDIAGRENWHRGGGAGGSLRATVFGANDGLVSNLSLVMGVAGGVANSPESGRFVLLAGIAGLLAGAFSMAAGEYVSMRAQREVFERQLRLEREELAATPEEEKEELALIYRAKGVPKIEAERLAQTLVSDSQVALDTLAREELGLDPQELGSPWSAAGSSFAAFSVGAVLPVLPFLFLHGLTAVAVSALLSAFALFGVGAALSLFTGRNPVFSGGRMLLIGAAAAAVTYAIGSLIGVSVAG